MMSVLVDGRASLPEGTPRQYSSYCGNYTFDGSTLTTVVDANCDPVRFTAPQVRKVRFEGERMVLTPPASRDRGREGDARTDLGTDQRPVAVDAYSDRGRPTAS